MGNVTVKDFRIYEKLEHKKEQTKIRQRLSQQWQTTWCVPLLTAKETITSLTQDELFEEESDLLKVGLHFSI